MVQAYILVQTEVGKAAEVAVRIASISGVTQAEDVTGPYDVIVRAEAENVDDLGRLVVAQIQAVSRDHQDTDLPHRPYLAQSRVWPALMACRPPGSAGGPSPARVMIRSMVAQAMLRAMVADARPESI